MYLLKNLSSLYMIPVLMKYCMTLSETFIQLVLPEQELIGRFPEC